MQIVRKAKETSNAVIRGAAANILFQKVCYLGIQKKFSEAITICDEIILSFGKDKDTRTHLIVTKALYTKGIYLKGVHILFKNKEVIEIFDEVISRCKELSDKEAQLLLCEALYFKSYCLGLQGKSKEIMKVYDEIISKFSGSNDIDFKRIVVMVLLEKAVRLQKEEESRVLLNNIIETYGSDEDPGIQKTVKLARQRKLVLSLFWLKVKLIVMLSVVFIVVAVMAAWGLSADILIITGITLSIIIICIWVASSKANLKKR